MLLEVKNLVSVFDTPSGVAVDKQGNIFVADTGNNTIRKITPQGEVVTVIGQRVDSSDPSPAPLQFDRPIGLALTHDGFLFIACGGDHSLECFGLRGQTRT